MSWAFIICTVIWVCEASKVNNLTVLAVGPNHRDNKDKIASSRSDPPKGSDKHVMYGVRLFTLHTKKSLAL